MAADSGWTAGRTFSLDVLVISILFLVVYISLSTLCTSCFSETPEEKVQRSSEEKGTPSHPSLSVNVEDHCSRTMNEKDAGSAMKHSNAPEVPAGPQHKNHTIVYSQHTHIYSHNRAKSDGFFGLEMRPRIPDSSAFSVRSTNSMFPGLPALPPIPPAFCFTTVQVEPSTPSTSGHRPETEWDSVTPPPDDQPNINSEFTETVNEEHPYACIENVRVSEPSSPFRCDEADEESESPYHSVLEWTDHTTTSDLDNFLPEAEKPDKPEFPAVKDDHAIYAEVKKKKKSIKKAPVLQEIMVLDEDEAPPVPEKTFDYPT